MAAEISNIISTNTENDKDRHKNGLIPAFLYLYFDNNYYLEQLDLKNGDVKVTGSADGIYQWYNKGEKPTDYQAFVFDKNQMKLLMGFSDTSKSPTIYDVLELSDTEMILRDSAKWLNLGEGEVIITRTLTFKRIN